MNCSKLIKVEFPHDQRTTRGDGVDGEHTDHWPVWGRETEEIKTESDRVKWLGNFSMSADFNWGFWQSRGHDGRRWQQSRGWPTVKQEQTVNWLWTGLIWRFKATEMFCWVICCRHRVFGCRYRWNSVLKLKRLIALHFCTMDLKLCDFPGENMTQPREMLNLN